MDNPIAANVLGTIGAVCWSVQLIPQIIINYRRHNAVGLQPTMMMLWAWAGVPLGVYNIVEEFNIALRIQPQILTTLSLITWIQCLYYEKNWSISKSLGVVIPIAIVLGGVELGLVFALFHAKDQDLSWPLTLMAVLSALLLSLGVLRHYWDIYKHRTVRGISFIFVGIDAAGDLFSLVSVLFQAELDVLGLVIYGSELVLWTGVMLCGLYFNFRPWMEGKKEQKGQTTTEAVEPEQRENLQSMTLHEMPSSTSVFRTPSSDLARARHAITRLSLEL